ncbi:hypothetical protein SAMN05421854_103252 [Amycolatopsis rubida]|uniref:Uncharacterized protein n=1 Tax=Amycolatopsis rubida TaxID=112413 RepID=A0A1I5KLC3_9PSEU|nr:hypothetical protein SAMN05421854_103252 [Amycolatopsis rubida]
MPAARRLSVKEKSPESLPLGRTPDPAFPSASSRSTTAPREAATLGDQPLDLSPREAATLGEQPRRADRDPGREAGRDVDRVLVRMVRTTGVEPPSAVPVERDAVAPSQDRVLEQFGGEAGIVVVQAIQQNRADRAHLRPFWHGEFRRFPAAGAEREKPGVGELVVGIDQDLAVRSKTLR